jgi:L-aspartate oxidase
LTADFLVIGSGIAGLRAALALAGTGRVIVATKADPRESNTGYAQGGIAVALGADDSPALHAADTIRAGDGLCDERAVRTLVEDGPRYVQELVAWGVRFDRDPDGRLAFGREAAHSVRRVLHAGDATGREIARVLWERVSALPSVQVLNDALVIELIVEDGVAAGAVCLDGSGRVRQVRASATLLATGGSGQLFRETTNPAIATGDGVALAYLAGARVADLEFVQFHPTALAVPGAPRFLVSEALRGEGARLVNRSGEAFMTRYHPDGDLAPRDIVARSLVREAGRSGGPVFLSLAHLEASFVRSRFPTIAAACERVGLDLARDPIPVGPAAHYIMGGVETDIWGRTSVAGLYAAGEAACTGVHGANRLASNSLLEGLVFGARAGETMRQATTPSSRAGAGRTGWSGGTARPRPPAPMRDAVREMMWNDVGLFRTGGRLEHACRTLDAMTAPDPVLNNFLTVARLIARAALRREESRGSHYREDFPARDDERWRYHAVDQLK